MTRRVWLLIAVAVICLVAAATYVTFRQPPALAGVVVDAVSGRVAAGTTLTYDGRVLRRFQGKDFAFAGGAPRAAVLKAEAPGYEPANIQVPADAISVAVSMKPVGIPAAAGVVVFPEVAGDRIRLPARLLDASGAILAEFPAVEIEARLIFMSADSRQTGFLELAPTIDYKAPALTIALETDIASLTAAASPEAVAFSVEIAASGKTLASRPFALPTAGGGQ